MIPPPSPDLATHLIRVTPVVVTQDADFAMVPDYDPESSVTYVGIVEKSAQAEVDEGVIYSVDGFTATVFAMDNPSIEGAPPAADGRPIPGQSLVEWGKLPAGFALPARGAPGPVTPPEGWEPEKDGLATADADSLGPGCWTVPVEGRT